jgi:hypothetical protein
MKRLGLVLLVLALFGLAPVAQAASMQLNLNCTIVNANYDNTHSHPASCTPSSSYSTITLADDATNPSWLDITVTLNAPWDEVSLISLNYAGSVPNSYTWSMTSGSVSYDPNDVNP